MTPGLRAAVFGASGAIGSALVDALRADTRYEAVHACSRSGAGHVRFDLLDEASIAAAVGAIAKDGPLDMVIVATGVLQEAEGMAVEKSIQMIDPPQMARSFAINSIGPALIAKHVKQHLPRDRRTVFAALSARVGSISDNRLGGWHSYRCAKSALNMILRNFAVELARTHPLAVVASLHPGTVDSALSKPFQRTLPPGQLRSPTHAARDLLQALDGLGAGDSGHFFDWKGDRIAF